MRHCNAILKVRENCLPICISPNVWAMSKTELIFVLIVSLTSSPVWAKKNPPRPFVLPVVVSINGAKVPAGTYELTCETHGSVARVTLLKDGRFVATAPGAWVKTGIKYPVDELLVRMNSDGSKSLTEIRIAGTARAIVLDQTDGTVHYSALQH
jgi:hypothetical protein